MNKAAKLALTTGAAIAAASALCVAGMQALLGIATRRNPPVFERVSAERLEKRMQRNPKAEDILSGREWLLAQPLEDVSILSDDGLHLKGHLLCAEQARRSVLLLHGWRERWTTNLGLMAKFLHEEGCNVLLAEQRSHGDSEGEYIGFGVLERYDCRNWAEYLAERFGTDLPLYLAGVSMGATTVLMATGLELPPNVRGIIADCGFTSPRAIMAHVLTAQTHLPENPILPLTSLLSRVKAGFGFDDYSTIEALKTNRIPVLFAHGDTDNFVPLAMTLENYLACQAPKELLIVEGAAHGMSFFQDRPAYRAALQNFFQKYDQPA